MPGDMSSERPVPTSSHMSSTEAPPAPPAGAPPPIPGKPSGGEQPHRKRKGLRAAVGIGVVGALAGGVAILPRIGGGGSGEGKPTATTVSTRSTEPGTIPQTVPTTPETTPREQEIAELQNRFNEFFAMPDEEFQAYAEEHYFRYGPGPGNGMWNYPKWIGADRQGKDSHSDNTITYHSNGKSNTIDTGPNFSLVQITDEAGGDLHTWRYLGFNLGEVDVPIQSGEFKSASVMYLGLIFPDSLGGGRMILPVTLLAEPTDPTKSYGESPLVTPKVRDMSIDHSLHSADGPGFTPVKNNEDFITRIKNSVGLPIMLNNANEAIGIAGFETQGVDDYTPDPSGVINGLVPLLLGDIDGFKSKVETAGVGGYVLTPSHHDVPSFAIQGFTDINDAMNRAPLALTTSFMKVADAPTSLK